MLFLEVGFLFTSRIFIIFLIPLVLLGLGIWTFVSTEVDRSDVRVGGALISRVEVELTVKESRFSSAEGSRKLFVELEGRNVCSAPVNLDPGGFHLVLARGVELGMLDGQHRKYSPMRYSSSCDEAPNSLTAIPPGAVRRITLIFWGDNMPRGSELNDYLLSLEYYDPTIPLILSMVLSPSEQ